MSSDSQKLIRKGCEDIWNAFMLDNAKFSPHDIPYCPTYLPNGLPKKLISFVNAKTLYNKECQKGNHNFHVDAFIHFYIDDQKFDGKRSSIWLYPEKALAIIKHFAGIISPDFSTYADFPDPLKRYNTYRMRTFAYWCYTQKIPVINNVRWGTEETWEYCFDGIEKNSIIFIGAVASGLHMLCNRPRFEKGLDELVKRVNPHTIIVYGSANYDCFDRLKSSGIQIIEFPSDTSLSFASRGGVTDVERT
jgi:hypothetical protein